MDIYMKFKNISTVLVMKSAQERLTFETFKDGHPACKTALIHSMNYEIPLSQFY